MTTPADPPALWAAPSASGPIDARVQIPGSKSLTNRYLLLGALGSQEATLRRPLRARDTELMVSALTSLGTAIDSRSTDWVITPRPWRGPASVDCGLAGNVMRFVPAAAGLAEGCIAFDGDPQAKRRPLAPMIDALRHLGVEVIDDGRGTLPFQVEGTGHITGGHVSIDASASSQFVSALLLAGCRFAQGVTLTSVGDRLPSLPHVEMTTAVLQRSGVDAQRVDDVTWHVPPTEPVVGEVWVEPDLSNAMPFLAAAMITGGRCRVVGWPTASVQPIGEVHRLVEQLGGVLAIDDGTLEVRAGPGIVGADLDMSMIGELVPTVTALATLASSPTVIRGVAHLRGHETDRLAALATEYSALGGDVSQTTDGLVINPRPLRGGIFHTYHDHRLATAAALTGLVTPGIQVEDVATTGKTIPDFPALWDSMLDPAAA